MPAAKILHFRSSERGEHDPVCRTAPRIGNTASEISGGAEGGPENDGFGLGIVDKAEDLFAKFFGFEVDIAADKVDLGFDLGQEFAAGAVGDYRKIPAGDPALTAQQIVEGKGAQAFAPEGGMSFQPR